ncbi:phosphatidylinositol 4-kinase beta 1-like isoform X2 [Juglans microcarpa x Juglans regia]|uniref:phosphatidylinositol 4-kinase beta 1-like isoform X2 n=1 Tax=Juglans microcarpa x Juglans regia TaxID=2249226 RepID=UPI001B7D9A03|nr:phosphatidylinositol 4-kinase beta 1-like isoform X2 [Juglans microcarpa x Juglans regia]
MVRLLGLTRGQSDELPREITSRINRASDTGENGWLIRFFDSAFFCEWIAVSYLYKHDHSGVRDYLCNRMYTLPLPGIESYLFQICYMMVHKPSPSLDKFVIDMCSKSLKIALKVHWFLMAEIEDSDDNEGINRIQEKCQIAATLMGEWLPLKQPQTVPSTPGSKNLVFNKLLSSKQRLLSLTSSPPFQKSLSFSPSPANNLQQDVSQLPSEENSILKKFIPSPKLLFRKSTEKDDDGSEKDGFFKRLLRDNRGDDEAGSKVRDMFLFRKSMEKDDDDSEKDGFFKRLLRDSRGEDEELTASSESLFKRLFRDSKSGSEDKLVEDDEKEGFFRKLFKEKFDNKKDGNERKEDEDIIDSEAKCSKSVEDDEKEGFFRKLFRDKSDDKKNEDIVNFGEKSSKSVEDDEKEGFFRKFFKDKFEDKKDANDKTDEGCTNCEEEEASDFSLLRRVFRVHPEDSKITVANENNNGGSLLESSPGTESFFRKLFRDRDRSVEDSELFGSKKHKEKYPGSPKQRSEKSNAKPPLPNDTASQFRKGAYHESLDFVQSLCETSYGLVDVFPVEDRKSALCESLAEINLHVAQAQNNGGVCFPMGKGMYRVVHIPEDEAVLLNSREKAPYLICVEVLKSETPSTTKDAYGAQKLSRGGIPLANGDALLPKPPPWACPLWTAQEVYRNSNDRMSSSTAQAIDQAMTHISEAKMNIVNVNLSVEKQFPSHTESIEHSSIHCGSLLSAPASGGVMSWSYQGGECLNHTSRAAHICDLEWVRVVLTVDSGVRMEDIEDQGPPHRKEHRRVPSTVAIEAVKAAAAKGEAPPGLPLKGAGQDSTDAQSRVNGGSPKASDALSGELWEVKKERIRRDSVYGNLAGWDLRSVIVKSGDDCRQEHLAVQLISHFYDIFQEAGLPLWLRPYEVLVTSSYTALIETIPDTASLHSIKSRYPNVSSLQEFFIAKYEENSPSFKLAQVKDRHNGNLLLDEEGHIIHIDFGFMLSNSPGGVNFESAPFKLTRELLEVMDSDAEGVPSEFFDYFKVLCIQGFLTCRKHAERIILLVEMLQDSDFPCFKGGPRTIQNLRKRFHLSLTEEQCVSVVLSLISSSLDAWRTRQYDYYQRVLNGIL